MWYRDTKEIKNWIRTQFKTAGRYDIPVIEGISEVEPTSFVGFNYAKTTEDKTDKTCHFYLDDYQFNRCWDTPDKAVELLDGFKYVLSPDFSLYMDYPKAIQIWNHYRKHWCGAYWQSVGLAVVPTISWSDEDSFEWCFDGEPCNSVVSVSTIGIMRSKETQYAFMKGYEEMMKVLQPVQVLAFGISFGELKCLQDDKVVRVYNRRFR